MGAETKRTIFPLMELPRGMDEMILAWVPPEDLNNKCKLVCRRWRDIISGADFARRNFLQTKSQKLLMVKFFTKPSAKLLEIESSDQGGGGGKCKIQNTGLWSTGRVRSSCNGLVIVHEDKVDPDGMFQVVNLLTRACVTIPAPKTDCRHYTKEKIDTQCAVGLGYDPVTGTYKVVHLYVFSLGFEVFTLNSCPKEETWRFIPGPWSDKCNGKDVSSTFELESVRTGTVLHWFVGCENYIVSIDVSDERNPFRTDFPVAVFGTNYDEDNERNRFSLVDINGDLSFIHNVGSSLIDIYILDQSERIWSKKHSILRESKLMPKMWHLSGVCSLRDGQVLVLEHQNHPQCLYVYDVRRRVLKKVKTSNKSECFVYISHTSSLLHWTHNV